MIATLAIVGPATTRDLTTVGRLAAELDAPHMSALPDVVRQASEAILSHCQRPEGLLRETVEETFRFFTPQWSLLLSRDLAPAVSAVVEDGVALTSAEWLLDGATLYRLRSDRGGAWTARKVVVTYAAGLAAVPPDVERACLDVATAILAARGRDRAVRSEAAEGVGNVSYLDPGEGQGFLTAQAHAALGRYVRGWAA